MGQKSEVIQHYGVGVQYGQRPSSAPGATPQRRFITISTWDWKANDNPIGAVAPDDVARQLGASSWRWEAVRNPLAALAPDDVKRDVAASAWEWVAEPSEVAAELPVSIVRGVTASAWEWVAESGPVQTGELVCCDRVYVTIGVCLEYQSVCCDRPLQRR